MCPSKESRGLGFGKISLKNCALLGKLLWKFLMESFTLWH